MCKEDVRLGRKTQVVLTASTTATPTVGQIAGHNPNRKTLIVSALFADPATTYANVQVSTDRASVNVVAMLNAYNPSVRFTVEECGQIVYGPLYAIDQGDNAVGVTAMSVEWMDGLDDL